MKQANASRIRASTRRLAWMWGVAVLAVVLSGPVVVASQTASAAPSAKSKSSSGSSESAEASISAAVTALESGKAEAASQQLSTVISGGKISTTQMARALYYRGMAYRKMSKPAQAIADFTSALWIKNGLEAAQRNDALLQRAGAYREAGLADQADADEKRVAAAGASAASSGTVRVAAAEAAEPASSSPSGLGLGNFFGSLFGGGSSSSSQPPSSGQTTAAAVGDWSTSARQAAPSSRPDTGRTPPATAVSSWATGSTVRPNSSAGRVQKASVQKTVASDGSYVQVAAVRSREQAQTVAAKIQRIPAATSSGRSARIDETVMGNMGTLYRVRLGPFASASEVDRACPELRKAGLDCLIIGR